MPIEKGYFRYKDKTIEFDGDWVDLTDENIKMFFEHLEPMSLSESPKNHIPLYTEQLSVGSIGSNVRIIQETLNALVPHHPGRLWKLTVDGKFGYKTRHVIYAFQSIANLPITGVVNEATWNKLMDW